jgi:hypothetical protein
MSTEENTRTRAEVTKRSFKSKDGEYTGRATTETVGFRVELVESGEVFEHSLSDFSEGVLAAAAAFGLVTSITNTVGGKALSAQERAELIADRLETLLEGDWAAERQSGPRSSQLLEAIIRVRTDGGATTTPEQREALALRLKNDPEAVKAYLGNAKVAAAYADIKAKAALERAKKLAGKAEDSDDLPEI